jgi:hypothetical protein
MEVCSPQFCLLNELTNNGLIGTQEEMDDDEIDDDDDDDGHFIVDESPARPKQGNQVNNFQIFYSLVLNV